MIGRRWLMEGWLFWSVSSMTYARDDGVHVRTKSFAFFSTQSESDCEKNISRFKNRPTTWPIVNKMAGHKIKLQSSDGDTFDVEVEIAKQSATIKTMLEGRTNRYLMFLVILCWIWTDLGMDEEEDVIPLPNVNSAILKKVRSIKRDKRKEMFLHSVEGHSMGDTSQRRSTSTGRRRKSRKEY